MRTLAIFLLAGLASSAAAHPGVSIVRDSRGNLYYSDLKQVWVVAPGREPVVAVPNVHTHELYVDASDTLYGEHLWYNGEQVDTWAHSIWKRTRDGKISFVYKARPGFRTDFSFVRDAAGNHYFAQGQEVRKNDRVLAHAPFRDIRWMTVTRDGVVYLVDGISLVRVTQDGKVKTIVPALTSHARVGSDRHRVMGLWTDRFGNVYAAIASDRLVKRITPAGAVTVVAKSPMPWSVSGGLVEPDGTLWLLEYFVNAVRIRKVPR
jgi:hypothetical protein